MGKNDDGLAKCGGSREKDIPLMQRIWITSILILAVLGAVAPVFRAGGGGTGASGGAPPPDLP